MYYKKSSEIIFRIKGYKHKIKLNNSKKRRGFTLIELIAVMAIIGILATILLPQVTGYINEAKKTKVMDQCRKVVMASESYGLRYEPLQKNIDVNSMKIKPGVSKYLEGVNLNNLPGNTTLKQCQLIVEGAEFELEGVNELLNLNKIEQVNTIANTNSSSVAKS